MRSKKKILVDMQRSYFITDLSNILRPNREHSLAKAFFHFSFSQVELKNHLLYLAFMSSVYCHFSQPHAASV